MFIYFLGFMLDSQTDAVNRLSFELYFDGLLPVILNEQRQNILYTTVYTSVDGLSSE